MSPLLLVHKLTKSIDYFGEVFKWYDITYRFDSKKTPIAIIGVFGILLTFLKGVIHDFFDLLLSSKFVELFSGI